MHVLAKWYIMIYRFESVITNQFWSEHSFSRDKRFYRLSYVYFHLGICWWVSQTRLIWSWTFSLQVGHHSSMFAQHQLSFLVTILIFTRIQFWPTFISLVAACNIGNERGNQLLWSSWVSMQENDISRIDWVLRFQFATDSHVSVW